MIKLGARAVLALVGLAALTLALTPALSDTDLPEIRAVKVGTAPQIDGRLDDPCWQKAAQASDFVIYQTGKKATVPTEAYLAYDDDCLYIAFNCSEPHPDKIQSLVKQRDGGVSADDCVEVFIQPGHSARMGGERYYHFILNATNVQDDQQRGPGARGRDWDGDWKSAASIGADAWTAEMAIPFYNLAQDISPGGDWAINLCREKRTPPKEISSWSYSPEGFHRPERFGRLTGLAADLARFAIRVENLSAGKYSVESKGYAYLVQAGIRNESGVSRALTVEVQDDPVEGKPCIQKLALNLAEGGRKEIAVKVPVDAITPRSLTFRLRDAKTEKVCYSAQLKPMGFAPVVEARLARYYYTTQKRAKVIASMSLAPPVKDKFRLRAAVISEGGVVAEKTIKVKNAARTELSLGLAKLAPGIYQVELALVTAQGQTMGEKVLMLVLGEQSFAGGEGAAIYGAEPNPTGDAIGGGPGYSRIVDKGDYTVKNVEELLAALKEAQAGQVVYVAADQIDLAGHTGIRIPAGVTLAGNRGKDGSPGPLLFNKEMPRSHSLFNPKDNVRITGVCIKGSDDNYSDINYDVRPASWCPGIVAQYPNLEVDNCEISNFHHSGVNAASKNIHVHHCLIHDVHAYPVVVGSKARLPILIEANIIHWIWHTIAGTGATETGYEARYNMVIYDKPPKSWGEGYKGHGFDMHAYRQVKSRLIAGDQVIIHHNTMLETGPSLSGLIRGVPRDIAKVYNNWFSEANPAFGVMQVKPPGNVWVYNNAYGPEKQIIPIGMETTPRINFKQPPPPDKEPAKVSGKLALDIQVSVFDGLKLKSVVIELDGKEIHSGDRAPRPGELVINTAELENGDHELCVTAVDTRGVIAKHSVTIAVDN